MAGWVYIFSNPLFSRVKIGKSTKDPSKDRLAELNSKTGTPEKYRCEYKVLVGDEHGLEKRMHKVFKDCRPQKNREFFEVGISQAINEIRSQATAFGGILYEEVYHNEIFKLSLSNGSYEGELKDGKLNGFGTYTFNNGDKYEGHWKDGKKHGHGTYTHPLGTYVGDWVNDKRHGNGITYLTSGSVYEGQFRDDNWNGFGTLKMNDGHIHTGEWKNGTPHGRGTCTWSDGEVEVGLWENGELIKPD